MKRLVVAVALLVLPALVHAQAVDGALRKIRDSKTITVAYRTDALPFSFNDDKNQPAGYTVDICKRVVASIEQQLKIQGLKVNWMPATAQNRFDLIAKKQADMECGASTATLSRMEIVDFSNYVFVDSTGVLVRNESGVKAFNDLAGKKIAAIAGTTNERALNAALKARLVNGTVVIVKSRDEGLEALEKGDGRRVRERQDPDRRALDESAGHLEVHHAHRRSLGRTVRDRACRAAMQACGSPSIAARPGLPVRRRSSTSSTAGSARSASRRCCWRRFTSSASSRSRPSGQPLCRIARPAFSPPTLGRGRGEGAARR